MNEQLMCCVLNSYYRCTLCLKDICAECYRGTFNGRYDKAIEQCPRAVELHTPVGQHIWAGTIAFTK